MTTNTVPFYYKLLGVTQKVAIVPIQIILAIMLCVSYALTWAVIKTGLGNMLVKLIKSIPVPSVLSSLTLRTKMLIVLGVNLITAVTGLYLYWDPVWLIVAFMFCQYLDVAGVEIGYHRLFGHQSFTCNDTWKKLLSTLGTLAFSFPMINWVMCHKLHHRHSDTERDPHPPSRWHHTYTRVNSPDLTRKENFLTVRNLITDPWAVFITEYYFVIYTLVWILVALVDFKILVYCLILPSLDLAASFININYISHKWGYRLYDSVEDNSRNNLLTGLWFQGQGQHNNHHYDARSYNTDRLWWEVDFTKPIIKYVIADTVVEARE